MNISNMPAKEKRIFMLAALTLLLISSFLHFWKIGSVPGGFYSDESSVGYNAWCIAETGADEYGNKYPVFFKCFDNYQDPVYIYSLVPLVKIFGPEKWVVRLPGALFHILAAAAFFLLATKYTGNRWICLLGAFFFSILPWLFPLSRTGIGGYMPMIMFIALGWYYMFEALSRRSKTSAVVAGVCWALVFYSHQIGRPMGAIWLAIFILSLNLMLIKRIRIFGLFIGVFVISMLPMALYVYHYPECMTRRFSTMAVWSGGAGLFETAGRISGRYLEYFSFPFLFVSGDQNLRHNTGGSGELFIFMIPFAAAGIYACIRGFLKNPYMRFSLLALASYPIAASLTIDHFHSTRGMVGAVAWGVVGLAGASYIWRRRQAGYFKLCLFAMLIFAVFEAGLYTYAYFSRYVAESRNAFAAPLIEAFEAAFRNMSPGETLYVSSSAIPQKVNTDFKPFWYSELLFFGKIPPSVYQKSGIPKDRICAFQGEALNNGILIRCNIVSVFDGNGLKHLMDNDEPVPLKSKMILRIPVDGMENRFIEIYRIRSQIEK